jgi:hypothetical protein
MYTVDTLVLFAYSVSDFDEMFLSLCCVVVTSSYMLFSLATSTSTRYQVRVPYIRQNPVLLVQYIPNPSIPQQVRVEAESTVLVPGSYWLESEPGTQCIWYNTCASTCTKNQNCFSLFRWFSSNNDWNVRWSSSVVIVPVLVQKVPVHFLR